MTPPIFKRYGKDSDYYTRFQIRGKRYLWSTKTGDERLAKLRAREYRDKVVAGAFHLTTLMKASNKMPSFEGLMKEYEALPISCTKTTRNKNMASMRLILRAVGLGLKDGVDRIGKQTALDWQRLAFKGKETAEHSAIVSCNSRLRQARSLFSERALAFYSVQLPRERISEFMAVPLLEEPEHMRAIPSPEAMAAAEARLPKFPAEWSAYLLAKYAGMRPSEIKIAEWRWLKGDLLRIGGWEGVAQTKSRKFREIRLDAAVLAELLKSKTDETFICGSRPKLVVERKLSVMLKALGFDVPDPMYSLRRWHASWRYENQSASAARDALGHATETVTMQHYARRITLPPPVPFSQPTAPAVSPAAQLLPQGSAGSGA